MSLQTRLMEKIERPLDGIVASGASRVFDLKGLRGFMVILDGGTASAQRCDSAGVVIPGSVAFGVASESWVAAEGQYFKITATGADCVVITN